MFKLDTGAQTELLQLQVKPVVNTKQRRRLKSYSGEAITTSGTCTLVLEVDDESHKVQFDIVKGEKTCHVTYWF